VFALKEPNTTLGRHDNNDVTLPGRSASNKHAVITFAREEITIMDLGSSNGTYVNQNKLQPHESKSIRPGDTIKFGNDKFKFSPSGGEQSSKRAAGGWDAPNSDAQSRDSRGSDRSAKRARPADSSAELAAARRQLETEVEALKVKRSQQELDAGKARQEVAEANKKLVPLSQLLPLILHAKARGAECSAARQTEKSMELGLEKTRREQERAGAKKKIDDLQLELGNKGQDFRRLQVRTVGPPRRFSLTARNKPLRNEFAFRRLRPRFRSHCRFRNRGTEYVSDSGVNRMSSSTK
jgi:pSer/pThr/pTyr-binding forkhead associated (FHA) protein